MKMKIQLIKICGCSESNVQREMYYMNTYVRKERSTINNLSFHLRKLQKEKQIKFRENRKSEQKLIKQKTVKKEQFKSIRFKKLQPGKPRKKGKQKLLILEMKAGPSLLMEIKPTIMENFVILC